MAQNVAQDFSNGMHKIEQMFPKNAGSLLSLAGAGAGDPISTFKTLAGALQGSGIMEGVSIPDGDLFYNKGISSGLAQQGSKELEGLGF